MIGVLPTYATVGAAAPWLLTLVRALQGLSAGGEFGGAVSIMTEFALRTKRGLYGAWQSFTVALGLLVGAGLAAILATVLSKEALNDWGWRVPFLLALPLGLVALWLRLRLDETPNFARVQEAEWIPADQAEVAKAIALGIGRLMGWSPAGYTFLVVMPSYLQATLNATFQQALVATVLANLGFAVSIMPAGWLSDRVGRRPVMAAGAALVGLAYSLSNAVFSGSAGLIITELIKRTKNIDIPAYYVMATCAVSVIALLTLRGDDHRRELRD